MEEFGFSKPLWIFEERVSKRERDRDRESFQREREVERVEEFGGFRREGELGWVFEESKVSERKSFYGQF